MTTTDDVPFKPGRSLDETTPTKWQTVYKSAAVAAWLRRIGSLVLLSAIALLVILAIRTQNTTDDEQLDESESAEAVAPADGQETARGDEPSTGGFSDSSPSESASDVAGPSEAKARADQGEFQLPAPASAPQQNEPAPAGTDNPADDGQDTDGEAEGDETADDDPDDRPTTERTAQAGGDEDLGADDPDPIPAAQPASAETEPNGATSAQDADDDADSGSGSKPVPVETTEPVQVPPQPQVQPVGPGSTSAASPTAVEPSNVTLRATGTPQPLEYYYQVYVKQGNGWQLDRISGWQSDRWSVDMARYEGQDVRWTVTGRTPDGELSDESDPRYLRVGSAGPQTISTNGSFEGTGVGPGEAVRVPLGGVNGWEGGGGGALGGPINIRGSGHGGIDAAQGSSYVSLTRAQSIAQLVPTVPGETIQWTVTYRSGSTPGEASISFGPATGSTITQGSINGGPNWTTRSGTYTVPPGQTVTRFRILARESEILIDNVQIVQQ